MSSGQRSIGEGEEGRDRSHAVVMMSEVCEAIRVRTSFVMRPAIDTHVSGPAIE